MRERAPLVAGTAILWSYIFSAYGYRIWYAVTAAIVLIVLFVAWRTEGLVRATFPIVVYFGALAVTAAWAADPALTLRWVLFDASGIGVFAVFYIAARNRSKAEIAAAIASVVIPAIVLATIEYARDPFTARPAGYALVLLPLVIPFAWYRATLARRPWPELLSMVAGIAMLLISRSRAPLMVALFALALCVIASRNRVRNAAAALAALIAVAGLLSFIPATRPMMLTTFIRATRMLPESATPAAIADLEKELSATPYWVQVRPREQVALRVQISTLARRLLRQSFPRGIGYMNFQLHFEKVYGVRAALHSMYYAWLLEGGALLAILVVAYAGRLFVQLRDTTILIALAATLLLGAFHQVHQMPALWLLLGLAAAVSTRSRPLDFAR